MTSSSRRNTIQWQHLNRLPWTTTNVLLTIAAGLSQGFGLAMFVPLLKMLEGSTDKLAPPFSVISDVFSAIGLPFTLTSVLFAIVILSIIGLALVFAQRSLLLGYSWPRFIRETNARLIEGILGASWKHLSGLATGEVTNQMVVEVFRSGRALTHLLTGVAAAVQIVIFMALSLTLSWKLLSLSFVIGVLAIVMVRPLQKKAYIYGEHLTKAQNSFAFYAVDYLRNFKLIKASGSEKKVADVINGLQYELTSVLKRRQVNFAAAHFFIQAFPVVAVGLIIGIAHQVLALETTIILVFLLFLARMAPLMTQAQQAYQGYIMELSAIELIDNVIAEHEAHKEGGPDQNHQFTGINDAIRFDCLSYQYPDADTQALKDIDIIIKRGQMVALVGGSGAGKSTLVDLLCGLRRPTKGRILIDDQALSQFALHSWRQKIGYVTQDVIIFNDTLRNNLLFAHPEAEDSDVRHALKLAYLDEFVDSLPEGMDTVMGEGGVRISGGQKQRLAMARALVGNPELLLLDEATSALDNESERIVQKAIDSIASEFTIVVVAHRLSTVRQADQICVMENGEIIERGTYDELRVKGGRFAKLHDLQFID